MRLFRVTGEIEEQRHLLVTQGPKGPGVYLRDCVVLLDPSLCFAFQGDVKQLRMAAGTLHEDDPVTLCALQPQQLERIRQGDFYGSCLVHVDLATTIRHVFQSSCYGEKVIQQRRGRDKYPRVVREHLPLGDSEGLTPIAMSRDGQELLIKMIPGANFRIHRERASSVDGGNTLVVDWSGRSLKVFDPARVAEERRTGQTSATIGEAVAQRERQAEPQVPR